MKYSYNKLWKMLIDKNMTKKELAEQSDISSATLARMKAQYPVSLDTLDKISRTLECRVMDIYENIE